MSQINLNEKHKWIIISDGWDVHYVGTAVNWKEALLQHIEWTGSKQTAGMYSKALQGFGTLEDAIEFINTVFDSEPIEFMDIVSENAFVNKSFLQ